ncbi:unnamed protein product [Cyprideis torosa]|uniref:DNA repair protein RecN n=1 Tax=Cyprideis torosa TaxID=163714 RepID=A0A7R8WUN5_9CRUS|nr:unnamed protein product [Cyprideis torosa]CAG0906607.1 unnamed protein product [Cyprideis torosa]
MLKKLLVDQFVIIEKLDIDFQDKLTIITGETGAVENKNVDRELLTEIGEFLVEIHGQNANHSLLGPDNQLYLLDLSGDFEPEVFENVANALDDVNERIRELEEEKLFLAQHKGLKAKGIQSLVQKFDNLGMKEGFIEEVEQEHKRLRTAKDTSDAFQSILGRLIATDGAVLSLAGANKTLEKQQNLEREKMVDLERYLREALKSTRSAVDEIGKIIPEYEIDTGPLYEYKKTLDGLHAISAETKVPFNKLADHYDEVALKLHRIRNGRERIAELNDALIEAKNTYRHHAHILSEKRVAAAQALSESITKELPPLKLNKAEFVVEVEEKPDMEWTKNGFNIVTFTARMNPGTPFSPIAETASGGELARMILAVKVVLQRVQKTPTLVFDEVDTGIGGAAAAAVGERLALLSDTTQVLVITHSPQVASRGNQHLHISKKTDGITTISSVGELSFDERIDEISRMLAGDQLTGESEAAAKSLINEAEKSAKARQVSA